VGTLEAFPFVAEPDSLNSDDGTFVLAFRHGECLSIAHSANFLQVFGSETFQLQFLHCVE
jgi:hypothetical protein